MKRLRRVFVALCTWACSMTSFAVSPIGEEWSMCFFGGSYCGTYPSYEDACQGALATIKRLESSCVSVSGGVSTPCTYGIDRHEQDGYCDIVKNGYTRYRAYTTKYSLCPINSHRTGYVNCVCDDGYVENEAKTACVSKEIKINLIPQSSRTHSLPAGPVVPVTAKITSNIGSPAGKSVVIKLAGSSLYGTTDGSGEFKFTYVPPYYTRYTAELFADCSDCSNTANTSITVDPIHLPNQCTRDDADDPGRLEGNPIAPGTGEKRQSESDYADAAPHGLSFTRGYSSAGAVDSGFGPGWSHRFAATVIPAAAPGATEPFPQWREVRIGADASVRFSRADAASAWAALASADRLTLAPDGAWRYTRASDDSTYAIGSLSGQLLSITNRGGLVHTL
nr:DUF6531 domain-containing protein [Burkholderiaceae bacterium]